MRLLERGEEKGNEPIEVVGKKLMKKLVIFCDSYDEIETALYLITHNRQDRLITIVIPGNHDLFEFFKTVNKKLFHNLISMKYFKLYSGQLAKGSMITKIFHIIPDIVKERRYLDGIFRRYFTGLSDAEVYFLARYMNPVTFYLVKKLGKNNSLIYMHYARNADVVEKYTPRNINDLVVLTIYKLVYGREIIMGKLPYMRGFACIPDNFLREEVDRAIDFEKRNEMMKGFNLDQFENIFEMSKYSVVYFDQNLIRTSDIPDEDVFKRELAQIFDILAMYFPEGEIARKYHPHYLEEKMRIGIGDILPDFIPAEFLFNENVKMYLSLFSSSISNVRKGLAVSIADLIS
ncbi:hypothetical protein ACFLVZ_01650, partial [Chloroflexota bacterium]